jgi:L-ascorbate metabolism protein UlaG (beta-lactamase superfamily)
VFPLSHGTRKFARIQHFGHLVEIGGMSVLHIGDAAMNPSEFERAGLAGRKLDVALIPVRFFQPGPGADIVETYLDAPLKIAVHIPPGELDEVKTYLAESYPNVMILDHPLQQVRFSGAAPPPP